MDGRVGDIFGVKNPDTEEIGFVSVMGMLGEHLRWASIAGSEGFYGYWNISNPALEENPLALFDVP